MASFVLTMAATKKQQINCNLSRHIVFSYTVIFVGSFNGKSTFSSGSSTSGEIGKYSKQSSASSSSL